ncbi:MAG: hypothetical protein E7462_05985 [Ruminococcaceae bacterium]|nr:hypothetical protein [Oscillospiraceae bacterium]
MRLPQLRGRKWNYTAIAFLMPFAFFLILMLAAGVTPFGNRSLLMSDCWHQYFPFFKQFRRALLSGDSLLYSWNVGMGMDYLGLISYYLGSPLNLLSVLLPESLVLPYFSLLTPLRLALASMFCAIFLKKLYHKNDLSIAIFGTFYGFCAWALAYQWNVMWLDTFVLLPLVALGTVTLLRDKKFTLYTVTLALSVLINYYIGFFTCIFVLLMFICYQICRCRSVKRFFSDLCRIGLFTVLAIGMTAILSLPTLSALGTTYSSINEYPNGFAVNIVASEQCQQAWEAWNNFEIAKQTGSFSIGLWLTAIWHSFGPVLSGMGQVAGNLAGGNSMNFIAAEGLPNIYTGVSVLFFAFLFLMAGKVKLRDKICSICLLAFLFVSFILRQLDYIWHGFHFTNMIPYRFSFIVSFVLIVMAYRAYLVRHRFKVLHVVLAALLTLEVFLLSKHAAEIPVAFGSFGDFIHYLAGAIIGNASDFAALNSLYGTYGPVYVFVLFNGVFLLFLLAILLYAGIVRFRPAKTNEEKRELVVLRAGKRRIATGLLSFVMVLEIAIHLLNFATTFFFVDLYDYPRGTEYTESMIKYMQEREDSLFYRAEVTHTQTLNDGALNGYNGITTFTSSANVKVTEFMCSMGFEAQNNWNRYAYEESSPVADLFLSLKYMIEREGRVEENPYFNDVHSYGQVHLLENNYYLPLGFLAESGLGEMQLQQGSQHAFLNQNMIFSAATGITDNVWKTTPESWLTISGSGVDINAQHASGYASYQTSGGGMLTFRYEIQEEGFLAMDAYMYARNSFHVYLNGAYLYTESMTLPQTFGISQVRPGDVVEIRISCPAGENSSMSVHTALLDDAVFKKGYELLSASTLELTEFSNTRVAGDISCNRDGLMYTSIPDNGNWKVWVDGKQTDPVIVGDAMVGVKLTKGDHKIVFTYENKSFNLGLLITLGSLLVFLTIVYLDNRLWWNSKAKSIYRKIVKK